MLQDKSEKACKNCEILMPNFAEDSAPVKWVPKPKGT